MMFVWLVRGYGDVVFEILTEPRRADDGSQRDFVWVKPVGRKHRRRGPKPWRVPKHERVFYWPLNLN